MTQTRQCLFNLKEFLKAYPQQIERCSLFTDVQKGDIVLCLGTEDEFLALGKAIHVGKTVLAKGHEDGKIGEVFVLEYNKGRPKRGVALNSEFVQFVCVLFVCAICLCTLFVQCVCVLCLCNVFVSLHTYT